MNEPITRVSRTTHSIHRLEQFAEDLFARSAGSLGITPRQVIVLTIADEFEDSSQTKLCEVSGIDRSTLADIVRRLVQRGLLARRRTRQDARTYAVRITSEGKTLLEIALPIAHQVDRELLEALSPSERETFKALLQKIVSHAAETEREGAKVAGTQAGETFAPTL